MQSKFEMYKSLSEESTAKLWQDTEYYTVYSGRENTDISSGLEDRGEFSSTGQVRTSPQELSRGTSQLDVSSDDTERDTILTSEGDRAGGEQATGYDTSRNEGESRDNGVSESDRPDEMGRIDEQRDGTGGGDSPERADIRLNSEENEAAPEEADAAFPLSDEQILGILNNYDEMNVTKQETLDFFLENEDGNRRADFIKAAYGHRAVEFEIDGIPVGYKKYGDGLELWAERPENTVMLSWDIVQEHTADLIDKECLQHERKDYLQKVLAGLSKFTICNCCHWNRGN